MRGSDPKQPVIFSYINLEDRVPQGHPLRPIRRIVDHALEDLSGAFGRMYAAGGRPSIPPEQLLRALLIQVFYSVRSERQLMEQLDYNLLFRWFVGLNMDDPVWHPTTFTKNRDRLLEAEIAVLFFGSVLEQARSDHLLSAEHFTVDGTLLEAWASQKSFRPRDEEPPRTGGRPQHGARLPGRGAEQRDARVPHRSGRPPGEEEGQGSEAGVLRERDDGEPQRLDHRRRGSPRHGPRGSGVGVGDDGTPGAERSSANGRCRQALRHGRVRSREPEAGVHAARGAEHERPQQPDRRQDDAP